MAIRTCEKCGHSMRMVQFANETKKRLTCPDCGWRPTDTATMKKLASLLSDAYELQFVGRDTGTQVSFVDEDAGVRIVIHSTIFGYRWKDLQRDTLKDMVESIVRVGVL